MLDSMRNDIRYVARLLGRSPGVTAAAVLTLGFGIGAATAVFSVVHSVLLNPLPYRDPDRLVRIVHAIGGVDQPYLSDPIYLAYADTTQAFEELGVWVPGETATITGQGVPEQVRSLTASRGVLSTLGVAPEIGRWFSAAEDATGRARRRDARLWLLAAPLRRRSRRDRARDCRRRPPAASGRRDAGRLSLRRRVGDRPAAAARSRCADSGVPAARRSPAAPRRHAGASRCRRGARTPGMVRARRNQARSAGKVGAGAAAAGPRRRRRRRRHALGAPRRDRRRPAARLRQRRQPAAGAGRGPPPGTGHPRRAGRELAADRPAAPGREPDAVTRWRTARHPARRRRGARAGRDRTGTAAAAPRDHRGPGRTRLRAGDRARLRPGLRAAADGPPAAAPARRRDPRRARRQPRPRAAAIAAGPGRGAARAGAGAAGRHGADDSQLPGAASRRSRVHRTRRACRRSA